MFPLNVKNEIFILFLTAHHADRLTCAHKLSVLLQTPILGRMVAYSGQTITWDEAMNSNQTLGPDHEQYSWNLKYTSPDIAIPGVTKVLG